MGLSGYLIECGFGQYQANLYDWDVSGKIVSYIFLGASGAIPVEKTVVTTLNISGQLYPASGVFVNATATVNSGLFVTVPISSISGNFSVVPTSTLSGVVANSGLFVNATATITSGQVWLASGSQILIASGQLSGQQVNLLSGNQVQVWSGTQVNTFSGFTYPASGINTVAFLTSGSLSGQQVTTLVNLDKTNYGVASIASGTLSGQQITLVSGQSYTASGIYTTVSVSLTSGQVYLASGTSVLVYSGQLSGQQVAATATISSGASVVIGPGGINVAAFASGVLTQEIPQDVLTYDYSGYPASGPIHTLGNATRKLINRWDTTTTSGNLTVFKEDGMTPAYLQSIGTASSGANPIVSLGDS